jgi:predicted Zn-dependent protease with MMP-like domain
MISLEEFEEITMEITETFPEAFFRELHGGVMVRSNSRLHPAAEDHDLFIMGEYHCDRYLGRFIVLYYGSFVTCFADYSREALHAQIRKVLLHEFRHHLESLAGERDLEVEDAVQIAEYKYRRQKQKDLTDEGSRDRIDEVNF